MKILVTGGTTFVSKFTAEYFSKRSHDVYVLNRNSREQVDGVHLISADRTKLGNILDGQHFDLIIDVTAYTQEHIRTLINSNVMFDNYIFISSSAVYPETNSQPFKEEQKCGKNSIWGDYGINKFNAEQYLIREFPSAYILRPPYFYGVYENLYREIFPFDCALEERKFYIPGKGDMKLQFFNVSDLCKFIEILIQKHPNNHIFNVGNPETITIKEWVELCYKAAGKTAEFVNVDKAIPQREYFCFHNYEYMLDVSKQSELMPETVSLEQGLKDEFDWYISNCSSVINRKPYIKYIEENLR